LSFCKVSMDVFERFLVAVRQGYNDNPYHNWRHAFDVVQATFAFLLQFSETESFTPLDKLALLVSSLCHDLGHPGCNNDYLVKTECEVASLYNHRSVLENCHSFMLFRMLGKRPELDIFAALSKDDRTVVKKIVIECILSTDPSVHFQYVSKLSAIDSPATATPEQKLVIMQCIVKMADISNVARNWEGPGYKWSCLVNEEFFNQGDALKSCGMDVPAFLDRNATTISKNSKSFIDSIALPLFKALGRLFPKFNEEAVPLLIANRAKWENQVCD